MKEIAGWCSTITPPPPTDFGNTAGLIRQENQRHTIRDLVGVDFDTSGFPEDPPAAGFDNNGRALTVSPLHLELYYNVARQIPDRAIVTTERPQPIKWRFEPESGDSDSNRVVYDGQRVIVNGGNNPARGGFRIIHHENWHKHINAREFRLPHAGDYIMKCLAGRIMTYALGREPGLADQKTIAAAVTQMKQNGRTLRSLIQFVVTSDQFRHHCGNFVSNWFRRMGCVILQPVWFRPFVAGSPAEIFVGRDLCRKNLCCRDLCCRDLCCRDLCCRDLCR